MGGRGLSWGRGWARNSIKARQKELPSRGRMPERSFGGTVGVGFCNAVVSLAFFKNRHNSVGRQGGVETLFIPQTSGMAMGGDLLFFCTLAAPPNGVKLFSQKETRALDRVGGRLNVLGGRKTASSPASLKGKTPRAGTAITVVRRAFGLSRFVRAAGETRTRKKDRSEGRARSRGHCNGLLKTKLCK